MVGHNCVQSCFNILTLELNILTAERHCWLVAATWFKSYCGLYMVIARIAGSFVGSMREREFREISKTTATQASMVKGKNAYKMFNKEICWAS